VGSRDAASTHAWTEVYVPGAGWITFDPTTRSVGGFNLIPVAVARDIRQANPVAGSFVGGPNAFHEISVDVLVIPIDYLSMSDSFSVATQDSSLP
jgi:transglutaminase-like putative cysteine protease